MSGIDNSDGCNSFCKQCFVVPFWYAEALLQAMSLYIQSPLPCKSLLGTAQTCCSASCRCRLRVSAKRSFSTPQECAAITGRDVHRDWDCIPTSRIRTANLQCHACLSLCIYRGTACWSNPKSKTCFLWKEEILKLATIITLFRQ